MLVRRGLSVQCCRDETMFSINLKYMYNCYKKTKFLSLCHLFSNDTMIDVCSERYAGLISHITFLRLDMQRIQLNIVIKRTIIN